MADYYPLLARALDALPDRSPGLRRAVYDRARSALINQLRSLDPPLSEDDIDLERRALDTAIERLEVEYGGIPAPANDAAAKGQVAPAVETPPAPVAEPEQPPAPSDQELPEPMAASPEVAKRLEPSMPAAPSPRFDLTPAPAPEGPEVPREAPIAIAPRKAVAETPPASDFEVALGLREPEQEGPIAESETSSEATQGRQRPRIATVAPKGRSRILRNLAIGTALAVVIGAIAVAAYMLRDKPQMIVQSEPESPRLAAEGPDAKFGDRVGSEPAPVERPKPRVEEPAKPAAPAPVTAPASVAIAQRAVLIEESKDVENTQPISSTGRVTWRLDTANGDQGQPLQTAAVATVNFPEAGLNLVMTIQKNLDATLPASHTVSLSFTEEGADAASRIVQDVGLLQAKDDESGRGSPVSGLPVRVRDNLFLIGLSSLPNDIERNTDLLLHRSWLDLAMRYTSGRRAVITFEKGQSGNDVLQQAFEAWR